MRGWGRRGVAASRGLLHGGVWSDAATTVRVRQGALLSDIMHTPGCATIPRDAVSVARVT